MNYRPLGRTGVLVSPLCLGAMNFGGPTSEADAVAIINRALDGGSTGFVSTRTGPHATGAGAAVPRTQAGSVTKISYQNKLPN